MGKIGCGEQAATTDALSRASEGRLKVQTEDKECMAKCF